MGARNCKACCSDHAYEGNPEANNNEELSLWEEHESDVAESRLVGELLEVPTKPSMNGCLQRLNFTLGGDKDVGVELTVLQEPQPALVISTVDPKGQLAKVSKGGSGICPGDMIVEVQNHGGSPEELFEMLSSFRGDRVRLSITVRPRTRSFDVQLIRAGPQWRRLGLSVALRPRDKVLLVAVVHQAGLVPEWNGQNCHHCICSGDRVVAVNGLSGDAFSMFTSVLAANLGGEVTLRIETPPRSLAMATQVWAAKVSQHGSEECLEML
eukprot:TRINITY_DN10935_c0_g2_i1.p1 TRINITY_DN10935_c0_g2~~TRINITY_DN10935_c0_g2_i1.p1  ORF type:complete len:268 (-),score=50.78 TRINITY_DN10935_c0_g2_i1:334-1137(-)